MWRKGICTTTVDGWQGDCERVLLGTWPVARGTAVHDANSCVERCRSCLRCQFVSFSRQNRDCSWFHSCDSLAEATLTQTVAAFLTGPRIERNGTAAQPKALGLTSFDRR